MNTEAVLTAILAAALVGSVPLMLASVGEAIGERSGLLNLGIEGVLLASGLAGFWVALESGNSALGLLSGAGVGLVLGLVFGVLTAICRADQVMLGLGATMAGLGGTAFVFREVWGSDQPLLAARAGRPLDDVLDWLPVIGPAIGQVRWPGFLAWALVGGIHLWMQRSRQGLQVRAAGESPLGLEASGGNVARVRLLAAAIAGTLTGFGGAYLTTIDLGLFTPGVAAGIGFMAVAVAMLGRRNPLRVALFALAFGLLTGLGNGLQLAGISVRPEFLRMIPYIGVVAALVLLGRDRSAPAALGVVYRGFAGRR